MYASALRNIACAGALATGLLLAGIGAPISFADTGDTGGPGAAGADDTPSPDDDKGTPDEVGQVGGGTPGNDASDDPNRPTSTVGNGRNDVVDPNEPIEDRPGENAKPARKYKSSIRIPVLRIPTAEEFAAPGVTPPSAYFGTAEVGVPFLGDVLNAFSQPEPEPTPGPAFRTQQEAPAIDATGGDDGGGIGQAGATGDAPPVFEAPLVVAPPMPIAAGARIAAIGASAARAPAVPAGAQPAVAGARTPLIRGSLPPTAPSVSKPLTPLSGQATRVGYPNPQSLRNPTVGELSAVALPGVAGLMFFTFSGGVIGYRQANSARFVRTAAAGRFLD